MNHKHIYYYHLDHLGTPQEMTDSHGKVVWAASYRAFGNLAIAYEQQIENNLRFQGQYYDSESGLHYNRFRYYDPSCGRYLTQDPIGLAGGLNPYQYASDPLGFVDPLGLCKESIPNSVIGKSGFYGDIFQNILSDIRGADFSAPIDGSVFWTGYQQGNQKAAMIWAESTKKTTIEMTLGGKWLEGLDLYGQNSPITEMEADNLWRAASAQFSRNASGEINVFKTGTVFDRSKVFYGLELKQLAKNLQVKFPIIYRGE